MPGERDTKTEWEKLKAEFRISKAEWAFLAPIVAFFLYMAFVDPPWAVILEVVLYCVVGLYALWLIASIR